MARRPRGTRDFAPADMVVREHYARRIRDVFGRFGYNPVQTPAFEELELFTAKSGDGIISELYNFQDKGGRDMTLRPELTAPVMRMYFQDHAFDPKPLKWFYFGACYRYDRPQEGRYREFWQFGCEQIGAGTPLAYAELIALAHSLFQEVGLADVEIRVGHVGVLRSLVDALGLGDDARPAAMRAIDKQDRDALGALCAEHDVPEEDVVTLLAAMDAQDLSQARSRAGDHEGLDALDALWGHLGAFGVPVTLDLGIARGLDYYTGIVFEAHCKELDAQSQVLGGGGYDLSGLFGGQPTPTMGFGLGFDRTLVALEKAGVEMPEPPRPDVYLGALGDAAGEVAIRTASWLRGKGARVELDLLGRNPAKINKAADAARARRLVIIGDRDIEQGQVTIKHLDDGEQQTVPLAGFEDVLLEHTAIADLRDYD